MDGADPAEFECPCCGQGGLQPVNLIPFPGRSFWICGDCESLWDQEESPRIQNPAGFQGYSTFMEAHGYTGDWRYVTGATTYVFNGKIIGPDHDGKNILT
ncbi:hypothetical protein ACXR0O_09620 [Verrucomicrobiota bacterium sgz303538]